MTIASTTSKQTFTGNSSATSFPFTFRVLEDTDLVVVVRDTDGAETTKTLTTDYTVSLTETGGTVSYPVSGSPLPTGYKLVVYRDVPLTQELDLVNGDGFDADLIEESFDKLTMITQQWQEQMDRAVLWPVSTPSEDILTAQDYLDTLADSVTDAQAAQSAAETAQGLAEAAEAKVSPHYTAIDAIYADQTAIDNVAADLTNIDTVSGISGNVTTVAGISSNVTSVAGNASNINTVAGSIANVNLTGGSISNVNTVAGDLTNIDAVAGNKTNIDTVAGISANVTTVAGVASSIPTVAADLTNIDAVAADLTNIDAASGYASTATTQAGIATAKAAEAAASAALADGFTMAIIFG